MGVLLNMYGGASEALEQQVSQKLNEIVNFKNKLLLEKNEENKRKIKESISKIEKDIAISKEKMKQLLMGAAESASKAASALGSDVKSNLISKLSSGFAGLKFKKGGSDLKKKKRFDDYSDCDSKISLSMTGGSVSGTFKF